MIEPPAVLRRPYRDPVPYPVAANAPSFDLRSWKGKPWSILLCGEVGSGKSMFAVQLAILHRRNRGWHRDFGKVELWVGAYEVPALAFMSERDKRHREGSGKYTIDDMKSCELLVLDDYGRGHAAPAATDAVSQLLYARHSAQAPTIITSNLDAAQVAAADLGLASRLSEGLTVVFKNSDRRRLDLDAQPGSKRNSA